LSSSFVCRKIEIFFCIFTEDIKSKQLIQTFHFKSLLKKIDLELAPTPRQQDILRTSILYQKSYKIENF
jgi:hypothetical protein